MPTLHDFVNYIIDYKFKLDKEGKLNLVYRMSDDELYDLGKLAYEESRYEYVGPTSGARLLTNLAFNPKEYNREEYLSILKSSLRYNPLKIAQVDIIPDKPLYTRGRYLGI